jgi:hypothetical protein
MRRETGKVEVPKDYFFRMAKMDYENWKRALAREFYQNSVDAGATEIKVSIEDHKITVEDNGCGMDFDTIKNKLLVLGGSKKRAGATGAFGKAKEILFFSWKSYTIMTNNLLVSGEGADYTIEEVSDFTEGTTCEIEVWEEEVIKDIKEAFRYVARKFEVAATITLNGDVINSYLQRGELVKSENWADLYLDKDVQSWYCEVRINGQWMFSRWHGNYEIGSFVLEVKGHSTDALTSNRDALKQEYRQKLDQVIDQIVTNTKKLLEPKVEKVRELYAGTGKVRVYGVELDVVEQKVEEVVSRGILPENLEYVVDQIIDALPQDNLTPDDQDTVTSLVEKVAKTGKGLFDLVKKIRFIGYSPDFVVIYDKLNPPKGHNAFMRSRKARVLANAWTEIVKQVLMDNGKYIEFRAGFNFLEEAEASMETIGDDVFFYLNPDHLFADLKMERKPKYTNQDLLTRDLLSKAIHEVAHLWKSGHNEEFVGVMHHVDAATWKSWKKYFKIVKESLAVNR